MSGMAPWEFHEVFVSEDYADWQDDPDSLRKAMHLAVSAGHLADHYCRFHQRHNPEFEQKYPGPESDDKGLNQFLAALYKREPMFKLIRHMANAYKHLYTRSSCSVSSGGAIEYLEHEEMRLDQQYSEPKGDITIKTRDGSSTTFSAAIAATIQMWDDVLSQADPWTG
jgi:hypothetical protein